MKSGGDPRLHSFETVVGAQGIDLNGKKDVKIGDIAAGVRRSRSGNPLIPAGFGVGLPEVTDDIWIDFADKACVKWVLALPDLAGSRVKIRITPIGTERLENLKVSAHVKPWPDGPVLGEGQAPARLVPDPRGEPGLALAGTPNPSSQSPLHQRL